MAKSGKKNKKFEDTVGFKILLVFSVCAMFFGIIFGIVSCTSDSGEFDKYLKKPLKDCPEYTLKEGLDRIDSLYSQYYDFKYELRNGKNSRGESRVYVYFIGERTLYNQDIYTNISLDVNDNVVIGDYVYSKKDNSALGNSNNIKALLCNN